jgi:hypothetical protein
MSKQPYQRDPNAVRLDFHGMDTVHPPDMMRPGKFPYAQNVRAYLRDSVTSRATQDSSVLSLSAPIHSLRRLNDSTPAGPAAGFILVAGAGSNLYAGSTTPVDTGLSGDPVSLVPFRPNASVQPWMYVGDSVKMDKIRSDGTRFKTGIAEPQVAPTITAVPAANLVSLIGAVTVSVWGDSPHSGPVGNYIWKNASDPAGSGPIRSSTAPTLVTDGNSLLFDTTPGNQNNPVLWTQFQTFNGVVDTVGTAVNWVSGDQFGGLAGGGVIIIQSNVFTILTVNSNISITLTSSAGTQSDVTYQAAAVSGTKPLFQPALESEGYADFNCAIEATLFIPVAGTYTLSLLSKDEALWGIGGRANGTASWPPPSGGDTLSVMGQHVTALNGYPLIPRLVTLDGGGQTDTASIPVTFSAAGNYPLEIDWDYWHHSGRTLKIQVNGQDIPPIPQSVITQAQYRYRYRGSQTGAKSNPSPASPEQSLSVLANTLTPSPSPDPQVDKIDFFRLDLGLQNYTYVGTGPNAAVPFSDTLLDVDVAANPILEFDNYEPFPSIDLPRSGVVDASGGVVTWVSGDKFNVRWLPGTIIIVGTVAYTLDKRPTSDTTLTAVNVEIVGGFSVTVPVPDGTNLPYEIAEPDLAAQPLPYIWGPTDNIPFVGGVGDPLRPGTWYWCKGNDPDSAPQTNQLELTSPSEPLQNGCIVNGVHLIFSTERAFLALPNFFNSLATVQGTVGSTWTIQESISTRGLYIARALAVDGGGNVFFRAKDGVYISPSGQGCKSITDDDLYNLFPHEGMIPQPVTRGGFTVYPPDDTQSQKMEVANGYLYYDYFDATLTVKTPVTANIQSLQILQVGGGTAEVIIVTDTKWSQANIGETATLNGMTNRPDLNGLHLVVQSISDTGFAGTFLSPTPDYGPAVETGTVTGLNLYTGTPRTLVYDIAARGWLVDAYESLVTVHRLEEGAGVNGTLVGCLDGTIRPLNNTGQEIATATVVMPSFNAGDTRAQKHFGDLYIEAGPQGS